MSVSSTRTNVDSGPVRPQTGVEDIIQQLINGYSPSTPNANVTFPDVFFYDDKEVGMGITSSGIVRHADTWSLVAVRPSETLLLELLQAVEHLTEDVKYLSILVYVIDDGSVQANPNLMELIRKLCAKMTLWQHVFLVLPSNVCKDLANALDKELGAKLPCLKSLCLYPSYGPIYAPDLQSVSTRMFNLSPNIKSYFFAFKPAPMIDLSGIEPIHSLGNKASLKFICILTIYPWILVHHALAATTNNLEHIAFVIQTDPGATAESSVRVIQNIVHNNLKTFNMRIMSSKVTGDPDPEKCISLALEVLASVQFPHLRQLSITWDGHCKSLPESETSTRLLDDLARKLIATVGEARPKCKLILKHVDKAFLDSLKARVDENLWEKVTIELVVNTLGARV